MPPVPHTASAPACCTYQQEAAGGRGGGGGWEGGEADEDEEDDDDHGADSDSLIKVKAGGEVIEYMVLIREDGVHQRL